MKSKLILTVWFLTALVLAGSQRVQAQTQTFTYQGSLKSGTAPANGLFAFQFDIYGSEFGGESLATNTFNLVEVRNGVFTVTLSATTGTFDGAAKFLEIRVKPWDGANYELLTPRQLIASAPYAVRSLNAQTAINATNAQNATTAETALASTSATFDLPVDSTITLFETINGPQLGLFSNVPFYITFTCR